MRNGINQRLVPTMPIAVLRAVVVAIIPSNIVSAQHVVVYGATIKT
jgi:hypothetical protein